MHWLITAVASQDAGRCVLAPLRHVLPELLMLASGNRGSLLNHYKLLAQFKDIPASWTKPPRFKAKLIQFVEVPVQLDMTALKQAVQQCAADK
jgi:hypothetical protein